MNVKFFAYIIYFRTRAGQDPERDFAGSRVLNDEWDYGGFTGLIPRDPVPYKILKKIQLRDPAIARPVLLYIYLLNSKFGEIGMFLIKFLLGLFPF